MSTGLAKRENTVADTVSGWLAKARTEKAHLLPKDVDPDRFWQVVTDQLRTNREIAKCSPESVYRACLVAAQYGLEVGVRNMAHIVRFGDQAQLLIGYEGKIWLGVARSKTVRDVNTIQIRLNDFVERTEAGVRFRVNPFASEVERGPVVGYVAIANLTTGGRVEATLSEQEYLKRRPRFWEKGPHATHRDEMWEKGAVHKLFSKVPLTPDVAATIAESDRVERAIELDAEVEVKPPPTRGVAAVLGKVRAPVQEPEPEEPVEWIPDGPPEPEAEPEPYVDPRASQGPSREDRQPPVKTAPLGDTLEAHRVAAEGVAKNSGLKAFDRWTSGRQLAVKAAMAAGGHKDPEGFWRAVSGYCTGLPEPDYLALADVGDLVESYRASLELPMGGSDA